MMATRVEELPVVAGSGERILRGKLSWRILPFLGPAVVARGGCSGWRRCCRFLPFLGPAFVACVAYIDPGNFATNIAGGSQFGYTLVWVVGASNLIAGLIQAPAAQLRVPP